LRLEIDQNVDKQSDELKPLIPSGTFETEIYNPE